VVTVIGARAERYHQRTLSAYGITGMCYACPWCGALPYAWALTNLRMRITYRPPDVTQLTTLCNDIVARGELLLEGAALLFTHQQHLPVCSSV
jgi:hypothetical protein